MRETVKFTTIDDGKHRFNWGSQEQQRRRRCRLPIAASHHINLWLGKTFPKLFPFTFVIGYPKSGTSWASQVIADVLYVPYPQHALLPLSFACVLQTHVACSPTFPKAVYMMRDGRDVMVSHYFHVAGNRKAQGLKTGDIRTELPAFIRESARQPNSSPLNWSAHVKSYFEQPHDRIPLLRYEDLLADGVSEISRILEELIGHPLSPSLIAMSCERHSFQRLSGRSRGADDRGSWLRNGETGDWKNHFTPAAADEFLKHFGDALILSGYESDDSWAKPGELAIAA